MYTTIRDPTETRANALIKRLYCPTFKWKHQIPVPLELYPPANASDQDPVNVDYYPKNDTYEMDGRRGTLTTTFKDFTYTILNSPNDNPNEMIKQVNDITPNPDGWYSLFGCDLVCFRGRRRPNEMNEVQHMIRMLEGPAVVMRKLSDELLSNIVREDIDLGEENMKRLVLIRALARSLCLEMKNCIAEHTDKYDDFQL